mgnify:CR=1 FL=1
MEKNIKKENKIIIDDKIYIPEEFVDFSSIEKHFTHYLFYSRKCPECKKTPSIRNTGCDTCQEPDEELRLANFIKSKKTGKKYISVPKGHIKRVQKVLDINFSEKKIKDKRSKTDMSNNIKWIGKLREGEIVNGQTSANQKELVDKFLKKNYGIIQAAPRTGKTVIGINIAIRLGKRTLIIAHQRDLLENFLDTIKGNEKRGKKAMTNVPVIEEALNREIVGIVDDIKDIDKYDIAMINYQKFISKYGDKRIKDYLYNKFGFVIIDEVHFGNGIAYSKFLNQLNTFYMLGLTATPKRVDQRDFLMRDIIGPVVARSESKALSAEIKPVETGIGPPPSAQPKTWNGMLSFLQRDKNHLKFIVDMVFKDLDYGANVIIIPLDRLKHVHAVVTEINNRARDLNERGFDIEPEIAFSFHRKTNKEKVLEMIDKNMIRVVVPIRSMMKTGIDMKEPDVLYNVIPTSNPSMYYQLVNRICTPKEGFKKPVVRHFIDKMPQSFYCYKSIYTGEISFRLKKDEYNMKNENKKRSLELLKMNFKNYHPKTEVSFESFIKETEKTDTIEVFDATERIRNRNERRKKRKKQKIYSIKKNPKSVWYPG